MTVGEAIILADRLSPNAYPDEVKIHWLSNLDGQIFEETMRTHEDSPVEEFVPYTGKEQELLVQFPYAESIYVNYLQMQFAKENGEAGRYNQAAAQYNNAYAIFQSWYIRTHMPKTGGFGRFLF